MPNLIFFGHDAGEPALQRRIEALTRAGANVTAFTMRRGANAPRGWINIDLGQTRDQAYRQRLGAMARALPILSKHRNALRRADIFYARNLDMLAIAATAKMLSGSKAKIVYECLDVHRLMTRRDIVGTLMRSGERALLDQTSLLVISAPAFLREYFERWHPGRFKSFLIENRLPAGREYGSRGPEKRIIAGGKALTIGWFGNLRCKRSLALLRSVALKFPDRVRVIMRGYPASEEIPDFDAQVSGIPNLQFKGRYKWPDDLAAIYDEVDLVWAGDFHDPSANSRWLLPNRIYEGGYFATPPIAPENAETGRWIATRGFGFTLPEPLEQTLPDFLAEVTWASIEFHRAALLEAPTSNFVQTDREMKALLVAAMA